MTYPKISTVAYDKSACKSHLCCPGNSRKVVPVHRHKNPLAVIATCLLLLTACVGISSSELKSLGSTVIPDNVDFEDIYNYAGRAKAAYSTEAAIRASYPKTIRVSSPGNDQVLYFLEQNDKAKTQYITVRGTTNKKNFSEDLEIKVREDHKAAIPVDTGFDLVAQAIYMDVKPYLKTDHKTYLTGHSLGGAVAALLAVYIAEDGFVVERVVTFGQPRFTTAVGAKSLDFLPLTRVVDENDVIPMLPPATTSNGKYGPYEHVGPEIILLEGPRYVFLPSHDANRIAIGEFWRSMGIADLPDHKMDNYLARLSTKLEGAVQVAYNQREKYVAKPKKKVTAN